MLCPLFREHDLISVEDPLHPPGEQQRYTDDISWQRLLEALRDVSE